MLLFNFRLIPTVFDYSAIFSFPAKGHALNFQLLTADSSNAYVSCISSM